MKKANDSKAKNTKRTASRLLSYLKAFRWQLILIVVVTIVGTGLTVVAPRVLGYTTTELYEGFMRSAQGIANAYNFTKIAQILFVLFGIYVLTSIFNYIGQYLMIDVTQKTMFNLREDVSKKIERLPLNYFDTNTYGDVLSRVTNDIDNISNTLQQSVIQLITSFISIVGVLAMMLIISPLLTLIVVISLPLCIYITKKVAKVSQRYFKAQQDNLGNLNGHVEEMYTGHKVIKVFNYEERSMDRFKKVNEDLYESGWKAQFISGIIMPIMTLINNISYVFVCIVGGLLMIKNAITLGDIQAFIQYAKQFSQPIVQSAQIVNLIQSAMASAERVFELLDETEEVTEGTEVMKAETVTGKIDFDHVAFGYDPDKILIKDMSLKVEPGQMVAIVGPTGAGKSTMINLLMRFYELNGGTISIDGQDISKMSRSQLRSLFGMVLQDTWLFKGTIADNIAYGREDATLEEVIAAAKAAHADHFIRTLPDGYDTVINEEASNISQGQKQLLTIARAILADPKMLILDEATSSVDTRTELAIQKAMEELMKDRTSFVIAHRLSTIKDADVILVMKDGDIIEKGNHETLLKEDGFYAKLYNSQFAEKQSA